MVWIDHERAELGERRDSFAVSYVPGSHSGEALTVTEFLDGVQQRSYTAESGAAQSMAIDMRRLADGEHSISITAQCGEDETTVVITFHAAVGAIHAGGTVQELQDEQGTPVFPVTLAKATLMSDGRSMENALGDTETNLREALEMIDQSSIKMDLVWKNASPGSSFAAQAIPLDLSGYDGILYVAAYNGGSIGSTDFIPVPKNGGANCAFVNAATDREYYRIIDVYADKVNVRAGTVTHQGYPHFIYGIKGIQDKREVSA